MTSTEILKLLSVSAIDPSKQAGGGYDVVTASDVSAALSGCPRHVTTLAYAKYSDDKSAVYDLYCHVFMWVAGVANKEKWKVVSGRPLLSHMSRMSVHEFVSPNRCVNCGGVGYVKRVMCVHCDGSGHAYVCDSLKSSIMGIDSRNYRRTWRDRYQIILRYLNTIDYELKQCLNKSLRGSDGVIVDNFTDAPVVTARI